VAKRWRRRRAVAVPEVTLLQARASVRSERGSELQRRGPTKQKDRLVAKRLQFKSGTARVGFPVHRNA